MFDWVFSLIAPHLCTSCGAAGSILCTCCKKNILAHQKNVCIVCQETSTNGVCQSHRVYFSAAYVASTREGALKQALSLYKFDAARGAATDLASILIATLPHNIPKDTVIVPIPTIDAHIRQRGFDHTALLTKIIAKKKKYHYAPLLLRDGTAVQKGASRAQRHKQAKHAFRLNKKYTDTLRSCKRVLLVDDVYTTGATINAAAKLLVEAGVHSVAILILARQPLDKTADF